MDSSEPIKIPLRQTNAFPTIALDYLDGITELEQFYKYKPNIESFEQVIKDKTANHAVDRDLLATTIQNQYKGIALNGSVAKNIELLKNSKTFTVCTGHQLQLFTGPLYFLYKIVTTINLAKQLKEKYPDYDFVPLFWLASEDHDFEEIASINLYRHKITWQTEQAGAVGRFSTNGIDECVNQIKEILGDNESSNSLIALFREAYQQPDLSLATRYLVNALFASTGLVILDADDAHLKQQFSHVIKDELLNKTANTLVENQIREFSKHYKPQVTVRGLNVFHLTNNNRALFNYDGNNYTVKDSAIKFSKEELLSELDNHPERFSPNVVLRPLYQEMILPNLAYIGGPSEVAYWLELKDLFEHYNVNFPAIMLRNSAVFLDEKSIAKLKNNNLTINQLFEDDHKLSAMVAKNLSDKNPDLTAFKGKLKDVYEEVTNFTNEIDKGLKAKVEAELTKAVNGLVDLEKTLIKSQKNQNEQSVNQALNIKSKLFPNGVLQERHDNFIPYYLKAADKDLIELLLSNFDAFDSDFMVFKL